MLESEQSPDTLQAAIDKKTVFVCVAGYGSFKVSATLKQFINDISTKQPITTVVIDLAECTGMDSTFMGVLAGLSGRLKQKEQTLELINLSDKNKNLLATLGVDQVLAHYGHNQGYHIPAQSDQLLHSTEISKKDLAEMTLKAHQHLVEICEKNRPCFKRVIEYLQTDIDRLN